MAEIPTWQEVYDAGKAETQARNPSLTDYTEGSFLDGVTGGGATLADEVINVLVELFAEQFLGTAEGEALDRLVYDRILQTRNGESSAIGEITWTRDAAGAYVIPAGTTVSGTRNGTVYEFTTDGAVTLPAADSTIDIPVTAVVAGRASNLDVGEVDTVVDTVLADPNATVSNAEVMAGGGPAEDDDKFRARAALWYSSVRRGTVAALKTAAISIEGVTYATVVEDFANTTVYIYIGDPDAQGNQQLADLVAIELENWRAAGILVVVLASDAEDTTLTIDVKVESGTDTNALEADIKAAVEAFGQTLDVGERVYTSAIECAVHDTDDAILAADVSGYSLGYIDPAAAQNALRFPTTGITLSFTVG